MSRSRHAHLLEEEDAFAAEPERREPRHTSSVFRMAHLGDGSTITRGRDPEMERVGLTVTALEYVPSLQDRKKNLAAPTVAARANDLAHARKARMGGIDRNSDSLVERSNW